MAVIKLHSTYFTFSVNEEGCLVESSPLEEGGFSELSFVEEVEAIATVNVIPRVAREVSDGRLQCRGPKLYSRTS